MTKKEKLQELTEKLTEKFGQKAINRIEIMSKEKFGDKTSLKVKFYQSIFEGYINPTQLFTTDENIEALRMKIENTPDSKKEEVILEIVDNMYDIYNPMWKGLFKKYQHILAKHNIKEKVKISI